MLRARCRSRRAELTRAEEAKGMRLWGVTPWRSRRSRIATSTGRICVWASRTAALASASLLLASMSAGVCAQTPGLKAPEPAAAAPPEAAPPKPAQPPVPSWTTQRIASRLKHNHDTLIVATSRPGTPYLAIAGDLTSAVGTDGALRFLPIAAEGGL